MTDRVFFYVPGKAAPQGSKRHVGGGRMIESSRELGPWRERVALAASAAMAGQPMFLGAVAVELAFVLPRPVSTPKRSTPPAVKRPDVDKLARAVLDALTDVVIADDSQVVVLSASKRLADVGEAPITHIRIEETR
jgi:crossover junction endodeoxyribonuclease RusA